MLIPIKGGFLEEEIELESSVTKNVYVSGAGRVGQGTYANKSFEVDELVLRFDGPLLFASEVEDFDHCLELPNGLFLGPSGRADDYVNHSCKPNCYVAYEGEFAVMRAFEPISRNDQLTFDYSLTMWSDKTSFQCSCGSEYCRGLIGPIDSLSDEELERYNQRGIVSSKMK